MENLSEEDKKFIKRIARPTAQSYWVPFAVVVSVIIPCLISVRDIPSPVREQFYLLIILFVGILYWDVSDKRKFFKIIKKLDSRL